jgi:hypothetical protein
MRLLRFLTVAALVALVALAAVGAAAPAGSSRSLLEVFQVPTRPASTSEVEFALSLARGSAPTAKVNLYVPAGYAANLAAAPGTKLGTAVGGFVAGTTTLTANGTVTADDPAHHTADACAPGNHAAVWLVSLSLAGQPVTIPVYVDGATPDLELKVAYVLTACFDPPAGAAARQLSDLDLDLTGVFRNPAAAGSYLWRALVTPYAGTTVNPTGASELQALVPLPHRIAMRARYDRRRHRIDVSGSVAGGGRAERNVPVAIYSTTNPKTAAPTRMGTARTKSNGTFAFAHAFRKTAYVFAVVPELVFRPGDCEPPLGPSPCANETVSTSERALVKVKV